MINNRLLAGIFALALVLGIGAPHEAAAKGGAKMQKIHKLMKLTGASMIAQQMLLRFKQALPQVPAAFWDRVMGKQEIAELMDGVAHVYAKHLKVADVDGLIAFFSSPVGRRFVKLQPVLVRDSMTIGQAWGQKMSQRIQSELKKEKKDKQEK